MENIRRLLEEQSAARGGTDAPQQVLFYSAASERFATTWQTAAPDGRWAFRFSAGFDVKFINYILLRMGDLGWPAQHILIATKGGGAFFYGAPDDAPVTTDTVVGLIPDARPPAKFANSVADKAPGAPFTLLSDSAAGDTIIENDTYVGTDMMVDIAVTLGQWMLASDQVVVRKADGTATTIGNIYEARADGTCSIKYPAPGGGNAQNFPLTLP